MVMQNNGYNRLNLYCMYAIKSEEFSETYETKEEQVAIIKKINTMLREKCTLNDEVLSLGEFAVVVYRVKDFISKVKKVAKKKNFACWNGLVGYYDPNTFNGSFSELEAAFGKRNIYQHQSEYRFVLEPHEEEGTKVIHSGSLEKIAFKIPTREINDKIKLRLLI